VAKPKTLDISLAQLENRKQRTGSASSSSPAPRTDAFSIFLEKIDLKSGKTIY